MKNFSNEIFIQHLFVNYLSHSRKKGFLFVSLQKFICMNFIFSIHYRNILLWIFFCMLLWSMCFFYCTCVTKTDWNTPSCVLSARDKGPNKKGSIRWAGERKGTEKKIEWGDAGNWSEGSTSKNEREKMTALRLRCMFCINSGLHKHEKRYKNIESSEKC